MQGDAEVDVTAHLDAEVVDVGDGMVDGGAVLAAPPRVRNFDHWQVVRVGQQVPGAGPGLGAGVLAQITGVHHLVESGVRVGSGVGFVTAGLPDFGRWMTAHCPIASLLLQFCGAWMG